MRKLRFSERQIAFIPTKAAAACPRGGTTCCPIVPEALGLATGPERHIVIEGSPSKIEMMCRSSFMNTKGYLPTASSPDDYVGGNGFRQDSTISTTLPFCCVNGCIRRNLAITFIPTREQNPRNCAGFFTGSSTIDSGPSPCFRHT